MMKLTGIQKESKGGEGKYGPDKGTGFEGIVNSFNAILFHGKQKAEEKNKIELTYLMKQGCKGRKYQLDS